MDQSQPVGPASVGDASMKDQWLAFGQKAQSFVTNIFLSAGITVEDIARRRDAEPGETNFSNPTILFSNDEMQDATQSWRERAEIAARSEAANLSTEVLRMKIQDMYVLDILP